MFAPIVDWAERGGSCKGRVDRGLAGAEDGTGKELG